MREDERLELEERRKFQVGEWTGETSPDAFFVALEYGPCPALVR